MPHVDLNTDVVGVNATVEWDDVGKEMLIRDPDSQREWVGSLDSLHAQGLIEMADDPTLDEVTTWLAEPLIADGMLPELALTRARRQLSNLDAVGVRVIWR